jgi:uncharacterized protein (DUF58 family)
VTGVPDDGQDALAALAEQASRQLKVRAPRVATFWLVKFSPAGRMLILIFVVAGSAAAGFGIVYPLYALATFLFVLSVVDAFVALAFRPRVTIVRDLPLRVAAGATVEVRAQITNVGRLPAFDLAVTEHLAPASLHPTTSAYAPRLGRKETLELRYQLRPERRGAYDLVGPIVVTAFPFGVFHAARVVPLPLRLLVYPRFAPLARVELPVPPRHQPGGLQLVSKVGESEEFIGDREYRVGDRLRDLDVRAWARLGTPIVREYQQEYLSRIALVVDTHVARRDKAAADALEAAISLGAAVADALARQEYVVDLFACGPDLYHLSAGRSLAYLDTILDVLACIGPCRQSPFERLTTAVADLAPRIGTAVVLALDWTEDREAFVRALVDRGVAVKLLIVRDAPSTLDHRAACVPARLLSTAEARAGGERL